MEKISPLINDWSMRFEAKHKESKVAVQTIKSKKNLYYTLFLKNQLKVAYSLNTNLRFCVAKKL